MYLQVNADVAVSIKTLYFPALSLQPLKMETARFYETSASTC
jgi:hypothetical protein